MRRLTCLLLFACLLCVSGASAQKLILTPNGMRSSANPSSPSVEYSYRNDIGQKELRDYCIQKLGQPEFFPYRVDYTDENRIKLSGYVKKSLKGERFILLLEFGAQSVRVSSELFDKNGLSLDCHEFFSKKGKLKDKKFKEEIERKFDETIRSMMEMKIVMH